MKLRFDVERNSNTSRTFHTNVEVGKSSIEHYANWLSMTRTEVYRKENRIVANMVMDVLRFRGVDDVFVKPYEVSVHLDTIHGAPSRWNEEIDSTIQNAFRQLYREQNPGKKVVTEGSGSQKEFHTNFEVSRSHIQDFRRPLRDSSEQYLNEIGSDGANLVRKLMNLPGVTEIWMQPYEVTIHIGKAFSWSEYDGDGKSLDEKVEEAFESVFGSDIVFA